MFWTGYYTTRYRGFQLAPIELKWVSNQNCEPLHRSNYKGLVKETYSILAAAQQMLTLAGDRFYEEEFNLGPFLFFDEDFGYLEMTRNHF